MANAIASGSATMPTTTPAPRSAPSCLRSYPASSVVTSWEPRYLTQPPSLTVSQTPGTINVLGLFLQQQRRF